ncbi:MAG TPA: PAS domain S-box protein [Spirochaetota bacterium]|nr:PAS domain S-box protein [Spirochaetota bacterium]
MNNDIGFTENTYPVKYLLQIANLHNATHSVSEYIKKLKNIIYLLHIPVFNISCLSNIDGSDHLLVFPELHTLKKFIPQINQDLLNLESTTINIKKLIANRSIFKKSILFSILRGYITFSDTISFPDTISINKTIYTLEQIVSDFSLASKDLAAILTNDIQKQIIESPYFGGVVSFPLIAEKETIGSFDIIYPKNHTILDEYEFSTLELIARLIANGLRQYRYQNKIIISETKYSSLINAIPMALYVINRDYTIIETNDTFKEWFSIEHPLNKKCYEIIALRDKPCNDCIALRVMNLGTSFIREQKVPYFDDSRFFKYIASPIIAPSGIVTSVVNILEDITTRIVAERKIEKFSLALAEEVDKQTKELKEKQKKLELVTNTLYLIKQANTIKESIHHITKSLHSLGAKLSIVTLLSSDVNTLQIVDVYPDNLLHTLQIVARENILNMKLNFNDYATIPFFAVIKSGKDIIIDTKNELKELIEKTFPGIDDNNKNLLFSQLQDEIIAIYPIGTKHRIEGSIAIALDKSSNEDNKDFINILLNAAAVEISRKRNQEELVKSELKYRNLVENTQDIIILCTAEGEIVYGNSVFYKLLDYPESHKPSFFDFIDESEKQLLQTIMKHSLSSGTNPQPFEIQLYNRHGKYSWYELAMSLVPLDHTIGIQIVARDIERKKRMEAHIQNLTEFQEKILQNEMIGIITADLNGVITSWNKGASTILGFQPFEILNTPLNQLVNAIDNKQILLKSSTKNPVITQPYAEITMLKKSGEKIITLCMSSLLHDDHDIPFAHLYFFIDISEKKRLEAESLELNQRLQHAQIVTIVSLAKLAEYRNKETGMHLERIMRYVEILAYELSQHPEYQNYITQEYIRDLVNSCLLHDIGKVGVPDHILLKPGKLTEYEFEIMKQHTIIGAETIAEAERKVAGRSYLNLGKEIACYHHERWDGSGYPKGLKGNEIPLSARIVAIADVYDALVSERPYKRAYPHEKAVKIIADKAGIYFDPVVVTAFLKNHNKFFEIKESLL